jgi:hypothetical protein
VLPTCPFELADAVVDVVAWLALCNDKEIGVSRMNEVLSLVGEWGFRQKKGSDSFDAG